INNNSPFWFDYGYWGGDRDNPQLFANASWDGSPSPELLQANTDYLSKWEISDNDNFKYKWSTLNYNTNALITSNEEFPGPGYIRWLNISVTENNNNPSSTIVDWARVRKGRTEIQASSIGAE